MVISLSRGIQTGIVQKRGRQGFMLSETGDEMKRIIRTFFVILIVCSLPLGLSACDSTKSPMDSSALVRATVMEIEKYGHAVLDITTADLIAAGYELGDVVCVRFGMREFTMPFFDGYYSNPGSLMLRGSEVEDNVAICINYGDFSAVNDISIGDAVQIMLEEKAGMRATQELCALKYSDNREDYAEDASFANFRAITAGRIGSGKLYRTASPVDNVHGRAVYADTLIESVGVATVLNLADSDEDIKEYLADASVDSSYYRSLYEDGKVLAIDLTGNFYSEDFSSSIAEGLAFLARKNAPYCIHCTEGKDRTGFAAMLLEALMGATLDEIVDDYMLSFYHYYGIDEEHEPQRYRAVLNGNLIAMLLHVTGAESVESLEQIHLETAVTAYLIDAGMSEEDIRLLKENLG